jgi:hypothetical protein
MGKRLNRRLRQERKERSNAFELQPVPPVLHLFVAAVQGRRMLSLCGLSHNIRVPPATEGSAIHKVMANMTVIPTPSRGLIAQGASISGVAVHSMSSEQTLVFHCLSKNSKVI